MAWLGGVVRALDILGALVVVTSIVWVAAAWSTRGRGLGLRRVLVDGVVGALALEAAACSLRFVMHHAWLQLGVGTALVGIRVIVARVADRMDASRTQRTPPRGQPRAPARQYLEPPAPAA